MLYFASGCEMPVALNALLAADIGGNGGCCGKYGKCGSCGSGIVAAPLLLSAA